MRLEREAWRALRADAPMTLTAAELDALRGINEEITPDEVEDVYLPLTRLLNLYVSAVQDLHRVTATFLGASGAPQAPFLIGLAGSVSAGKSTTARVLQALLARWPNSPRVDLVTTDGFLHPNAELERRGLMRRKGFPESYDRAALLRFVSQLKAGLDSVSCPVYSHARYDIVPDERIVLRRPDIVIIEGLNVLQHGARPGRAFVADFFDFSIYLDAEIMNLRQWYVHRFLRLRDTAFQSPGAYFHRYAALTDAEAEHEARTLWREINEVNLKRNILPTRERATLILKKGADHRIQEVMLRRL